MDDEYVLSPKRRELRLAVEQLTAASHGVVGAPPARVRELEGDVERLLRSVRKYEERNRLL